MGAPRVLVAALAAVALVGCGGEEGGGPPPAADTGEQVFTSQGCGGCHTLEAAGTNGSVGPNLDQALANRSAEFIRRSIVEPGARVAPGFPDVMPGDYGRRLSSQELTALVDYLARTTGR